MKSVWTNNRKLVYMYKLVNIHINTHTNQKFILTATYLVSTAQSLKQQKDKSKACASVHTVHCVLNEKTKAGGEMRTILLSLPVK